MIEQENRPAVITGAGKDPRPDATRGAKPDTVGFVLAGGQSSRMGADKALIQLAGRPLIAHAIRILRQAGLDASIAGARSSLSAFAPVIQDTHPDRGPLAGICSALASTSARYAVFLPVDLPLLPPSLVSFLLHHARVAGGACYGSIGQRLSANLSSRCGSGGFTRA